MRSDLHSLGSGSPPAMPLPPYRALNIRQVRQFVDNGYLHLPQALSREEIRELTQQLDELERQAHRLLRQLPRQGALVARSEALTFVTHAVEKSAAARRLCTGRLFSDVVLDLIGPNVRLYWDHAVYKLPSPDSRFGWHQDNGYTFISPEHYLTCWVALTDADERSGCLCLLPGGHRSGTLEHTEHPNGFYCFEHDPTGSVALPAKAGDVILLYATTPHCSLPNRATYTRKAYVVQFVPDGACAMVRNSTGSWTKRPAISESRQFPIVQDGRSYVAGQT